MPVSFPQSQLLSAFFAAGLIMLREGTEAVLILAAIFAVLKPFRPGRRNFFYLWAGIICAILLSVSIGVSATVLSVSLEEKTKELLEGVVGMVAVAVLFFVVNFLFHHTYVVKWSDYVRGRASQAVFKGGSLGLFALAFTVVFREGIETVLFTQALILSRGVIGTLGGLAVGVSALVVVSTFILQGSRRLPVSTLFKVTSALLIALAITIIGGSIHELQEVGWISETTLAFIPNSDLLKDYLGLYPHLETLIAQLALLLLFMLCYIIALRRSLVPNSQG